MTAENKMRDLPDDVLERMGLTRERWQQIRTAMAEREEHAPTAGAMAPDFDLPYLGETEKRVRLSEFRGKRPVALIFGSYT